MNWFQRLWQRNKQEEQLDKELQFHIQQRIADLTGAGLTEQEARRRVHQEFGGLEQVKEDCRDARGTRWLEDFVRDLCYAARLLRGSPGFTIVATATLALGIGANTSILTLVNTFALRPLAVREPHSIVRVEAQADGGRQLVSYLEYLDFREHNRSFDGLVAWNKVAAVVGDAPPGPASNDGSMLANGYQYAFGQIVSGNYFDVLGAPMALGRPFSMDDDRVPGQHAVVVLSHSFWQRRMQADTAIIGKTLKLTGTPFTVIGVMAPEFVGTDPQIPDFWAPIMMRDALVQGWLVQTWFTDRQARCLDLFGRLRPGVTQETAQTDLRVVQQQMDTVYSPKRRLIHGIRAWRLARRL